MGNSTNQGTQPYKYTGKELDMEHGLNLYDFEARTYDPAVGRFMAVDPMAEKYYHVSPYAYCANNPVSRIDPTGMEWKNKEDEEYAKKLSQEMTSKRDLEQKGLDKLNTKIATNQEKGKDVFKDQAKATGMQANIDNLNAGVSELTAMGDTKDLVFTYNKIDGAIGGTDIQDGVIVMDIANNGSLANGVHESSHGYDLWQKGRPTEKTAIAGEVKAYSRQFSFDKYSMPTSDFGRANSLSDINHRWVLGINQGGDYLYIRFTYPNRNPQDILKRIK
jgi:RHS repeat-associated protein